MSVRCRPLVEMWTPLSRASGLDGVPQAPRVMGALALASEPAVASDQDEAPRYEPRPDDDRVIHTGFAALDAIPGPGGLPKSASVAIRGDGSSGRTTLSLRVVAEAQAGGSVVAWLDLSRSFDPVEAGRPRRSARVARRHHPGQPGRGPLDRGLAPGRSLRRPARARPARRSTGEDRQAGQGRRSPPSARRARPPGGDPAPDPRCARALRRSRDRGRGVERPAPRARPPVVDPPRARHRRPADGGAGRAQSIRPAGAAGDAPDPLRGRRRTRRLPPPGRPPPRGDPHRRQGPRHRLRTDRPRCDCCTSTAPTSRSNWRWPAPPSPSHRARSCWAAGRGTRGRSSTRTRTPGRSACGGGSRWRAPIDSRRRRSSSIRILRRTGGRPRPPSRRSPRSARDSPGRPIRPTRRSGCSRSRSTASSRCGAPSRSSSSA